MQRSLAGWHPKLLGGGTGGTVALRSLLDLSANVFQQGQCLRSKYPLVLNSDGHEVVANTEVGILSRLSLLYLVCNCPDLPSSKSQM